MEWLRRGAYFFRRTRVDHQLEEEAGIHIEMRSAELESSGIPRAGAIAQARREFGPVLRMQEDSHEAWQFAFLEQAFSDLRYASRQLLKSPLFALVSLLSLALGIGASSAVFSVIYGVLLHPFPYKGADRMVSFQVADKTGHHGADNYLLLNSKQFQDFQKADVLDGAIAGDNWDMAATGNEIPEAVHTGKLSANAFQYFGVPPILGRGFALSDGPFGQEPQRVVILSYHFWQSHFGGETAALDKLLQLDHEDYKIIGVAPPSFTWFRSDVYVPLRLMNDPDRISTIDARLKPGITLKAAEARLQPLIESFAKETPKHFPPNVKLQVTRLNAEAELRFQGTLTVLFVAVTLLLAVGCANVSILLLSRASARQHELAVRAALGASHKRVVKQLFTEALLLAGLGCLFGVALAYAGIPLILQWLPENSFPNRAAIQVNGPVLCFSVLAAALASIAFGLWPSFQSSRPDISKAMRENTKRAGGSLKGQRLHTILIAAQVALTVLLLAGAGASIRTFLQLYQSHLGFDPRHLLTATLQFPDGSYLQIDERQNFEELVRLKISQIPGVTACAISSGTPPQAHFARQLEIFDQPTAHGRAVYTNPVSRELFETLKIPILRGQVWSEQDDRRGAHVVLVNEVFARRYWPNENVIGRKLRLPNFKAFTSWMLARPNSDDWLEVRGVVGNTPNDGLSRPVGPAVYLPYSLVQGDSLGLVIRTQGSPLALAEAVRRAVHTANAAQPVNEIHTAEQILANEGWATEQFIAQLFLLFAALALTLAAIGIYSVISFAVTQRYQELGIRMALGAQRINVVKLVLRSASRAVATGLAAGFTLCVLSNGALKHWTRGSMLDPRVILFVAVLLFLVMTVASAGPAWRAATVDPMSALRHD
jgi:predicted permease